MPRSWKVPGSKGRGLRAAAYLAASIAGVLLATAGIAGAQQVNQYSLLTTIAVPETSDLTCTSRNAVLSAFDISWTDARDSLYLLADRTNCAVDVYDAAGNTFLFRVGGFVGAAAGGFDVSGPDGILTAANRYAYVGDGDSTVKIVDLLSRSIIDTVSTGGTKRADEMTLDPRDNLVMVANDADTPPFVSFISTVADNTGHHNVVGKIPFPDASGGLEQSVWSARTGLIYMSVPTVGALTTGEIAIINPRSRTIVGAFPVNCQPAGLAIGPNLNAIVGCSDTGQTANNARKGALVISLKNGHTVAGPFRDLNGADEVWFNKTTSQYFVAAGNATTTNGNSTSASPVLGVIDATRNVEAQAIATTVGDHSVAVDPVRRHVFLPDRAGSPVAACTTNGCIDVFHQLGQDVVSR